MVRGTTAQFKFSLPYDYSEISVAKVVFWQPGNEGNDENPLPIYKSFSQCAPTNNPKELSVTLSQSETLRFSDKLKARVQLSAKTFEGTRFASKQELITVYPIYDDSILGDDDIVVPPDVDNDGFIILDGETIG
jgi:hypothetical protein